MMCRQILLMDADVNSNAIGVQCILMLIKVGQGQPDGQKKTCSHEKKHRLKESSMPHIVY